MDRTERENSAGDGAEAKYSNYFDVGFNAHEVILGFGQHYEEADEPRMHTRIVTAPAYANSLIELLRTALTDYEQKFGRIEPKVNE
jgi:hypothetical protein